ncbi:hypothetical protein NDI54_19255, partial [Haloarcula sp. S1AR25-5A]
DLDLATVTRVKRRISDVKPICLFAFYQDNAVVAVAASETTEPLNQKEVPEEAPANQTDFEFRPVSE